MKIDDQRAVLRIENEQMLHKQHNVVPWFSLKTKEKTQAVLNYPLILTVL